MKKIFTLLAALGLFAVAEAQPGNRDNRQGNPQNDQRGYNNGPGKSNDVVIYNDAFGKNGQNNDKFAGADRRRDMEIAQINRNYDSKVQRVQRNFFMSRFEKQRQLRTLEQQRQREISAVYAKYMYMKKPGNGRNDRNDRQW